MFKTKWLVGTIALAALALSMSTAPARAQENNITVDARGGMAIPIGDAKQMWKAGPNAGIGVAYWFNPRIAVRVDGEADFLSGKSTGDLGSISGGFNVPDMKLYHFGGGLVWRAMDPAASMWRITFNVGLGGTHMKSNDYPAGLTEPQPSEANFSQTYWSGYGGVRIGYQFHPNISFSVGSQAHYVLTDHNDFMVFGQFIPGGSAQWNDFWTIPVQGQFTFHF